MTRLLAPFVLVVCLAAASDPLSVVKPNRSGAPGGQLGVPFAGRFTATNVTVFDLVAAAYGGSIPLEASQITGLPPWAKSERFDVEARADDAAPTEDSEDDEAIDAAFAMVRAMLADRFHLRIRETSRQEPVYALVTGRNGLRAALTPTRRDCDAIANAGPFSTPPSGTNPAMWVPCGVRVRSGEIVAAGGTLTQLARHLAPVADVRRQVIDRTGVTGRFDFTVHWTPSRAPQGARSDAPAAVDAGPSLFTALQEQLGLRLVAARGPVRVIVVEHLERPTPN
jgi:uncharacterized protein (TIGR03435 family)